ncbi:MAG: FAD-dependent oxidoreductase [Verrucomicrobia bacterium]|jgi:hypothetical protein|nr:FAD-dependent oxidoreductase [Verrucomicrobiota bacterium]
MSTTILRQVTFSTVRQWLCGWLILGGVLFGQAADSRGDYDLVVVEGTPGGITMAVRAAREGLNVLLVNRNEHLGGILSSGLGVWDTQYEGKRSPLYDEVRRAIFDHYQTTYGENSEQYKQALPAKSGHTNGKFEPKVAEKIFNELVGKEKNLTVWKGFNPVAVKREGAIIQSITFKSSKGLETKTVTAKVFADCSYEGDLAALAKVPYRVGREARAEYNEPHAGKVFMLSSQKAPTPELAKLAELHDSLNLRKFTGFQSIAPESTGAADGEVQAFNYRTILSSDPANRLPVTKPANYDVVALKKLEFGSIVQPLPNKKIGWNRPQLIGPHTAYVEGKTQTRQQVMDAHWDATMGLLYFLQNDESVTPERRKYFGQYGLAKDEFTDNGHRPYEFYVREARRIVGRYVFTQHDAMLAKDYMRAPVHEDSIGVTEWYLDTHACTTNRVKGSLDEGKMMLHYETFPGQVPYRALLPQGVDNLLVPVCLSSTHVAWGTIRLEPTWMNICESAAYAAVQAVKNKQTPAAIDADKLLRTLADKRVMLSFFNDVEVSGKEEWIPAVQYFGAKGFFATYDARLNEPLTQEVAFQWASGVKRIKEGTLKADTLARALVKDEELRGVQITHGRFVGMLPSGSRVKAAPSFSQLTRGEALLMLWEALKD